jgi:hypothetical protein
MTHILALQALETDDAEYVASWSTLSWSHCGYTH